MVHLHHRLHRRRDRRHFRAEESLEGRTQTCTKTLLHVPHDCGRDHGGDARGERGHHYECLGCVKIVNSDQNVR